MWRSRRSLRIVVDPDLVAERLEHVEVGVRPALDASGSPSSSPANATRAARLPTPGGPWKRYACAGPSRERRAEQALRLGLLRKGLEARPRTFSRELVGRRVAVERRRCARGTSRRARGSRRRPRARKSSSSRSIRSRLVGERWRATRRVDEQEERPVGEQAARRREVQLEDGRRRRGRARSPGRRATSRGSGRRARSAPRASAGGSPRPPAARAPPRTVRPRPRGDLLVAVEDDVPHRLAELGAAGLARGDDLAAVGLECRSSSSTCVVLPEPSRPSKVMNTRASIGRSGGVWAEPGRPVDYPVQANRWRTRALLFAAVATLELLALVGLGSMAAARVLAGEVETVGGPARPCRRNGTRRLRPRRNAPCSSAPRPRSMVLNGNGISGAASEAAGRLARSPTLSQARAMRPAPTTRKRSSSTARATSVRRSASPRTSA